MKLRVLFVTCSTLLACTAPFWGQEPDKVKKGEPAGASKALDEIAQLGPGVHHVKPDNKGRIQTCVVVGQSRISTVLGKSKGLQDARTKARLACEAEFVRWLKTKVDVHVKNEEETILFQEGSEENDKEALRESGKSVEKTTQKFESTAQGLVRGLQVLGVVEDAKNKRYTLVMGWSAKTANATKKVQADLEDADPAKAGNARKPGSAVKGEGEKTGAAKKRDDKKLEDRKVASPDLKKFLD